MDARLNEVPCGFLTMEQNGDIIEVNRTLIEWTGYEKQQFMNVHIEKFLTVANKLIFHSYFYPNINIYGYVCEFFIHLRHADGKNIAYLMNARRYERDGMEVTDCILVKMEKRINCELELRTTKANLEAAYKEQKHVLAEIRVLNEEITLKQQELMKINTKLLEVSNTDHLTSIANRRYFQEKIESYVNTFEKKRQIFSLCILDIDFFKKVNDTFGHIVGDVVLRKLAELLKTALRPQDFLARYGGEEFVIIFPNANEIEALNMAQFLNKMVQQANWSEVGSLTISLGVATCEKKCTITSLIAAADEALYASKRNGRNRATHYDFMIKE
ncbi:sensor domain-containing diguanylate cyclase [Solibacillus cecembensis]|uniref:sensor domain-containing diguanylate cyclase n=1 Tax=Solibacillus cecembensis TaxID=459347 RepID=UPI003CFE9BEF